VARVKQPPRRSQRERVEESTRRLAEAAIELIAEKGYTATTAAEIGVRAGYSRAMVNVRHGSKDALLDSLLTGQYESRLDPHPDPLAPGLDQVMRRVDLILGFARDDPQLLRAMFVLNFEAVRAESALRSRIQRWLDHYFNGLVKEIRAGQADGSIDRSLKATEQAREFLSTSIGYAYSWIVEPDKVNLERELKRWRTRVAARLGAA
jgi:AcrR family transcriptional regulator